MASGECLSSIGFQYGFSPETLWHHEANTALRELRKDPYVLLPGDEVVIPDLQLGSVAIETGRRHTFRRKAVPAKLKLRLVRNDAPRAGERYELHVDGRVLTGSTDADGRLEHMIPPDAREGTLLLRGGVERYALKLGHLDPISEPSGVKARLKNLGLYRGPITGGLDADAAEALRAFQTRRGLLATGQIDEPTRAALRAAYGG